MAPTITEKALERGYTEVFQYSPTSYGMGTTVGTYMLHYFPDTTRVALIFEAAEWVKPALDAFEATVHAEKPDVVVKRWIHEFMATDLYVELTAAQAFQPEFLFHGQTGVSVPAFVKQFREMEITSVKGSGSSGAMYTSDEMLKLGLGEEVVGFSALTQVAFSVEMTPKFFPYIERFRERFGRTPLYSGVAEYDSMYTYLNAVEMAGTADPDAVIEALKKVNFVGVKGTIYFDEMQQVPIPWVSMQWQGPSMDDLYVTWPAEIAQKEPIPLVR